MNKNGVEQFTPSRLVLARQRRAITQKSLSESVGVSTRAVKAYEAGENRPTVETLQAISRTLGFPFSFFGAEPLEPLTIEAASFRALSKASSAVRDRAVAAGTLALEIHRAITDKFNLPALDLLDCRDIAPARAAEVVRHQWGLGQRPIPNMIHLVEKHGVRVFSLSEDCDAVDAFSIWRDGTPFMFLNMRKTAERSIFDAAHELGHLLLHRHGTPQGLDAERQADEFATNFLLPEQAIRSAAPRMSTVVAVSSMKRTWRASTSAIGRRLHDLGLMSDWSYKSFNIELARRGKANEPAPLSRETSAILAKTIGNATEYAIPVKDLCRGLCLPMGEIRALTFASHMIEGSGSGDGSSRGILRLVTNSGQEIQNTND